MDETWLTAFHDAFHAQAGPQDGRSQRRTAGPEPAEQGPARDPLRLSLGARGREASLTLSPAPNSRPPKPDDAEK